MSLNFSDCFLYIPVIYFNQNLGILLFHVFKLLSFCSASVTSQLLSGSRFYEVFCLLFCSIFLGSFLRRPYFFPEFCHLVCCWRCIDVYFISVKFLVESFGVGVELFDLLEGALVFLLPMDSLRFDEDVLRLLLFHLR